MADENSQFATVTNWGNSIEALISGASTASPSVVRNLEVPLPGFPYSPQPPQDVGLTLGEPLTGELAAPDITSLDESIMHEVDSGAFGELPRENKPISNPYGHILGTVNERTPCPDDVDFLFVGTEHIAPALLSSLPVSLIPPPQSISAPAGYVYPQSPPWTKSPDAHYACGICYAAAVSIEPDDLSQERDSQIRLTTHPSVDPIYNPIEKKYVDRLPDGMVKMVSGVPFRLDIRGSEDSKTYACYHTLGSIRAMYPHIYNNVLQLAEDLRLQVFGRPSTDPGGQDEVLPIFTLPFFRQNLRSQKKGQATRVEAGISEGYDGSYSIASTIEEGNALGTLVPALQISYHDARERLQQLLEILRQLYQLLGPLSMSRFEWKVIQFHLDDNNVFSFSGLKHGGVSVQFNVSSGFSGGDLVHEIGQLQGTWHVDPKDAITIPTLFVLILKLPSGAHEGSFLLGRYGLYMREADVWIVFMFFNGRDMHSGRQVSIHESLLQNEQFSALNNFWKKAGKVNRIGIPVYFPSQAVHRTGGIAVTPATNFSNHGSLSRSSAQSLNFSQNGTHLLGSTREARSRLAREAVFALFNTLKQSKLVMEGECASTVLDRIGYYDPDSPEILQPVERPPHDVLSPDHSESVGQYRGYYAYLHRVASSLDLHITRPLHQNAQRKLRSELAMQSSKAQAAMRLLPVTLTSQPLASDPMAPAEGSPLSSLLSSRSVSPAPDVRVTTSLSNSSAAPSAPHPPYSESNRLKRKTCKLDASRAPALPPPSSRPKNKRRRTENEQLESTSTVKPSKGPIGEEIRMGEQWFGNYEIEAIVGHCIKQGVVFYEVQFSQYDSSSNDFYKESELAGAPDLLKEYKICHPDLSRRRMHRASATNSHRLDALDNWLNPETLQSEYESLDQRYQRVRRDKGFYKNIGKEVQDWTSRFMSLNSTQNDCTGFLQCSPVDDRMLDKHHETTPQVESIRMLLLRAVEAAQCLPGLMADSLVVDVIQTSLRWQECRSFLILGDFLTAGLDRILNVLIHGHQHLGEPFMTSHYGAFAQLFDTVYKFLFRVRQQYRRGKESETNLELPWDLYGVRSTESVQSAPSPKTIRISWSKTIVTTDDGLYSAVKCCLETLLVDELVLPYLRTADTQSAGTATSKRKQVRERSRAELLARCQLRGILLQCLVDELDDETICATRGVSLILESPLRLFSQNISTDSHLLFQIQKNPEMLDPIRDWIRNCRSVDIRAVTGALALFINHRMVEFTYGKSIPDTIFDNPASPPIPSTTRHQRSSRLRPFLDHISITSMTLVEPQRSISLGVLGLVLREALNERRNLSPGIDSLRFLLEGRDPGHGREYAAADRDQFDPIRRYNRGAELLRMQLPGTSLAKRAGLSNLLVWMGTGQGNKTFSFLDRFGQFFYSTLRDSMGHFARGLQYNNGILSTYGYPEGIRADVETPPSYISGLVQISNSRIYGSACNTLKLVPTIRRPRTLPLPLDPSDRMDLASKFEPYWTDSVQEAWVQFLGNLQDQDPGTYPGERKSWSSCIHMLMKLQIPGFQSGLTVMQTANALAYAEIIKEPTLDELANWIWQNNHLGAFSGLVCLGFNLPSRKAVRVALTCLFHHMDQYLTRDDKILLGFGTIFLEHVLCKVSRWTKKVPEILSWAAKAEANAYFVLHMNGSNPKAFPLPLHLDEGLIDKILLECA